MYRCSDISSVLTILFHCLDAHTPKHIGRAKKREKKNSVMEKHPMIIIIIAIQLNRNL